MYKEQWNKTLLMACAKSPVGRDTQLPLMNALRKVQSDLAVEYTWVHQEPPKMPQDESKIADWLDLLRQVTA